MRRRGVTIWFLIAIIIIGLFLFPSEISRKSSQIIRSATSPVTFSMISAGRKITSYFSFVGEIGTLRSDNQNLKEELVRNQVDQTKINELSLENQKLKELLEYKDAHPEMRLVSANVISLDPTNFYDTIVVDRGSLDGVKEGMAVTSLGVLVGKTDQVSDKSSRVRLIRSKNSIVQVMLENSRTTGILRGGISGMTFDNIPLDTEVASAENVVTSGLGGGLPKGIYVGKAAGETSSKSDIFKSVEIKSPIDFSKLEVLFIVIGV